MAKVILILLSMMSFIFVGAQMPPAGTYDNLRVYESIILLVDGEEEEFEGKDYLYLDYESNGLYLLFPTQHGWVKAEADYWLNDDGYSVYTIDNPAGEELTLKISSTRQDIIVYKDDDDSVILGYEVVFTSRGGSPTPNNNGGSYGGYNPNTSVSSPASSGRTCISCSGTGKCKTCNGNGWYYHETGYYTGNSHQTRTDCPVCRGTGRCGTCHGNGTIH